VTAGTRQIGQGFEETTKGIGRTVGDGATWIHDGVKAFGLAVWDGMKEVGRAVERAFTD
jgi:hypothetical protein